MKTLASLAAAATLTVSSLANAAPLEVSTFNPTGDGIFPVTSTLISGDHDAILVDAQFQNQYADKVIEQIKQSGKHLKYIFISYSDPDYYFGADRIVKAFPDAKVISTAQTAWVISTSKDAKLAVWKDQLGKDAPQQLITPTAYNEDTLKLDGETIEIKKDKQDPLHSYLWIPSNKTVVGGGSTAQGAHIWMADTQGVKGIDAWIAKLDEIAKLKPAKVIPPHYLKDDFNPAILANNRKYLENFKHAVVNNPDAAGVIDEMKKKYPDLPDVSALEMGAKVFKGETDWKVYSAYPPIGYTAHVDLGQAKFDLHFLDNQRMTFTDVSGSGSGDSETVDYTAVEVSPNVFMVYWHENGSGDNVVHVQNWNDGTVWSNIVEKNGNTLHLNGTIKLK
ncbi:MoaF-related domain-containing protein [Carnimonas bestiolae]|uniref:MoaF-related domain-containing protein n=1 Tax=Carnimonas bestiolae TaxID=3402172 RepID=UPI003EDBAFF4